MNHPLALDLRILLLEDNSLDAELVTTVLKRDDPRCTVLRVTSREAYVSALESFAPEVILSNSAIVSLGVLDALQTARMRRPECPFFVVAATFDQTASECLKAGAEDFVKKSDLSRLAPAIRTALALRAPLRRLTQRQQQVLSLLVTGVSTREIARRLALSVKTVETHRAQLMKRLGIRELAGLVRYAVRVGIVSASH